MRASWASCCRHGVMPPPILVLSALLIMDETISKSCGCCWLGKGDAVGFSTPFLHPRFPTGTPQPRRFLHPPQQLVVSSVSSLGVTVMFPSCCGGDNTVEEVSQKSGDLPGWEDVKGRRQSPHGGCRGQAQGGGNHELGPHALGRWWKEGVQTAAGSGRVLSPLELVAKKATQSCVSCMAVCPLVSPGPTPVSLQVPRWLDCYGFPMARPGAMAVQG